MDLQKIFTEMYLNNKWGSSQSVSGVGSETINAVALIRQLPYLFNKYKIKSVSDCPCGDFNWMQFVEFPEGFSYSGFDIVPDLIERNNRLFTNMSFSVLDVTADVPPKSDLIICRDLLFHLPLGHIRRTLDNFKKSGSTYLLVSTHMDNTIVNFDIEPGFYRKVNLRKYPFYFPAPLETIIGENLEHNNKDKAICLWSIADLT